MDYLGCVAVRYDDKAAAGDANPEDDFSQRFYGRGGIRPMVAPVHRGGGKNVTPKFLYGGADIRGALPDMAGHDGDPYAGAQSELGTSTTARPVVHAPPSRGPRLRVGATQAPLPH